MRICAYVDFGLPCLFKALKVTLISVITALAISSLSSLSVVFTGTASLVVDVASDGLSDSDADRGESSLAFRSRIIASFCSLVRPDIEFARERPSVGEADSGEASGNLGTGSSFLGSSLTGSGLGASLTGTGSSFFVSTGCTGLTSCLGSGCLTALLTRVRCCLYGLEILTEQMLL